jgi:hypothetical protein
VKWTLSLHDYDVLRVLCWSMARSATLKYSIPNTHMLRLERVQYRRIRIAPGHMCSTQNMVFYRLDIPLKRIVKSLKKLNMGRCIAGYSDISSESLTRHELPALLATHFVDDHIEKTLSGVQTFMFSVMAP